MDKHTLLKIGMHRIRGAVKEEVYLRSGIDVTKPESIRAVINYRCNYKCQYCYSWQRKDYPEISILEWQQALLSLKKYIGSYLISFSGGEPFIKKGFVDLLTFCNRNNINWGVITNGSAFNQKTVEKVVAANPINIDISVDSPDSTVNDYVRGATDSLKTIGKGIELLRTERTKRNKRFLIRIKPTVTRQNFLTLPNLVTWAIERGADNVDFAPVRPEAFWDSETYSRLWIDDQKIHELQGVVETLIQMKMSGAPIETSIDKLLSFTNHFLRREVRHGAIPCRVGMRDYYISPTGDVTFCWEHPAIGNVTKQSAQKIWESSIAREIRARTIECNKFATIACANSCLSHRTLKQEATRAINLLISGKGRS